METVLFVTSGIYIYIYIYIYVMQMFDLYIMYIFIGARVKHTSSENAGQKNSDR